MTERKNLVLKNAEVCQSNFYHITYRCKEGLALGHLENSALASASAFKYEYCLLQNINF